MKRQSKEELMLRIYSAEERRNIDVAVPAGAVSAKESIFFVMDYNKKTVFGELIDLREEAVKRGVDLG